MQKEVAGGSAGAADSSWSRFTVGQIGPLKPKGEIGIRGSKGDREAEKGSVCPVAFLLLDSRWNSSTCTVDGIHPSTCPPTHFLGLGHLASCHRCLLWTYYVPVISLREITKRKILLVFGKSICEQINQRVGMRLLTSLSEVGGNKAGSVPRGSLWCWGNRQRRPNMRLSGSLSINRWWCWV